MVWVQFRIQASKVEQYVNYVSFIVVAKEFLEFFAFLQGTGRPQTLPNRGQSAFHSSLSNFLSLTEQLVKQRGVVANVGNLVLKDVRMPVPLYSGLADSGLDCYHDFRV